MTIDDALETALADVTVTAPQRALMAQHWQLMCQWNQRTNLTAIVEAEEAAWLHYRDSLEGLRHLTAGPVIDFGSGAGFPGLVLAIARPQLDFCLVEPRRKRVAFLQTAAARLGLRNLRVVEGRLQDTPQPHFAHAVTRATFSDATFLSDARKWLVPGGTILAWRAASAAVSQGPTICAYFLRGQARQIEVYGMPCG
jgi:16S rRNA (guanine527-N7)-methyltransferase